MTFEDLKRKYPNRAPAFPVGQAEPNLQDLTALVETYQCRFPPSFLDFQLKYCKEVPMGDFASEGFGFANNELEPYMNLRSIVEDYAELKFPDYLTPFKEENGDFWCFDNRSLNVEFPVVIFDHNACDIESDRAYQWGNFIDWLEKTMEEDY